MWWTLLAYALLSPVLGLLVGAVIRRRDEVDVHPCVQTPVEPAACPILAVPREAVEAAG